jgi:hypothetical protein
MSAAPRVEHFVPPLAVWKETSRIATGHCTEWRGRVRDNTSWAEREWTGNGRTKLESAVRLSKTTRHIKISDEHETSTSKSKFLNTSSNFVTKDQPLAVETLNSIHLPPSCRMTNCHTVHALLHDILYWCVIFFIPTPNRTLTLYRRSAERFI